MVNHDRLFYFPSDTLDYPLSTELNRFFTLSLPSLIEMNRLFPSIPLVAEEDSSFLRSTNLVGAVVDVVANKATFRDEVTEDSVLKAIDRGGKDAYNFGPNPATYWVS